MLHIYTWLGIPIAMVTEDREPQNRGGVTIKIITPNLGSNHQEGHSGKITKMTINPEINIVISIIMVLARDRVTLDMEMGEVKDMVIKDPILQGITNMATQAIIITMSRGEETREITINPNTNIEVIKGTIINISMDQEAAPYPYKITMNRSESIMTSHT